MIWQRATFGKLMTGSAWSTVLRPPGYVPAGRVWAVSLYSLFPWIFSVSETAASLPLRPKPVLPAIAVKGVVRPVWIPSMWHRFTAATGVNRLNPKSRFRLCSQMVVLSFSESMSVSLRIIIHNPSMMVWNCYFSNSSFVTIPILSNVIGFLIYWPAPNFCASITSSVSANPLIIFCVPPLDPWSWILRIHQEVPFTKYVLNIRSIYQIDIVTTEGYRWVA